MKDRPILFSASMVRAILAGTKTQTRRLVKPCKDRDIGCQLAACEIAGEINAGDYLNSLYGQPGDRLWVRETWQHANHPLGPYQPGVPVFYRADYMDDPHGPDGELSPGGKYRAWRPSIHMPRAASRIVLEITGMRVERLQNISETDARAEGVDYDPGDGGTFWVPGVDCASDSAVGAFRLLWESINGIGAWEKNRWVWVVGLRRVAP